MSERVETIEVGDYVRDRTSLFMNEECIGRVIVYEGTHEMLRYRVVFQTRISPTGDCPYWYRTGELEPVDLRYLRAPNTTALEVTQAQLIKGLEEQIDELRAQLAQQTALAAEAVAEAERVTAQNAALVEAANEAVHIFKRDDQAGQSAWNMRAVLLSALSKLAKVEGGGK